MRSVAAMWSAFAVLLAGAVCAEAVKEKDQPRVLTRMLAATPEMIWPVEERLFLPYIPSGKDTPACLPSIAKPSPEVGKVSVQRAAEQAARLRQYGHYWSGKRRHFSGAVERQSLRSAARERKASVGKASPREPLPIRLNQKLAHKVTRAR